jgi:predicted permease
VNLAATFAFVLLLLALGRVLRWRGLVPESAPDALNAVALYVCLPAAIFLYAPKLTLSADLVGVVAVPWLLLLASCAVVWIAGKVARIERGDRAVLLLQIPLGNTSFLGYSLIPALAGAEALRFAVIYDQLGSFVMLSSFGLAVIAAHSGGVRPTPAGVLRRMLGFPPFVTLLLALSVVPAQLPGPIEAMLKPLSAALLPMVGLAIGMQLKLALPRRQLLPLALALGGRLLLMPALALGLCALFGIGGDARMAVVLEAAMPGMITSAALAAMAGLAPELAAATIGYGIVLSMASLPFWRYVLVHTA